MNKPEILAPAGSMQSLRAAVLCSADAVYLGVKQLNARRSADNFDFDTLNEAIRFCHTRGVKVYLTLNTLINDNETSTATTIIERACAAGIDALILQDFAAASIASKCAPDMPLHASTQMSVQTLAGLNKLYEAGFKRAVLPREMSRDEILRLCKKSPIELEMFIHGALCMCVSGQCELSAVLGSRSGNRGACAQPCRLPFSADGSEGRHDLSLKDLSLTDRIKELADAGISSFKIEGRMKRPEYVAAAVKACRDSLGGELSVELKNDLKNVFSRSGFTDGYYTGKLGADMFGIRRKEDVVSAKDALERLSKLYEKEAPRFACELAFTVQRGKSVTLSAKAAGETVFCDSGFIPQEALNKPLTKESATAQLSKTGGTQFYVDRIDSEIDTGINVPVSVINSLRRSVIDELQNKLAANKAKPFTSHKEALPPHSADRPKIICRFRNEEQIPDNLDGISEIVIPLENIKTRFNISAEIPRGIFGTENEILKRLEALKERGVSSAWAGTLDGIALAQSAGLEITAGYGSNVFNSLSAEKMRLDGVKKILLSTELNLAQIKNIGGEIPRGVFAYGRLPLMLTRNCPVRNVKTCAECKKSGTLTDRKNTVFPIECHNFCSDLLNSRPVYMADRLDEIKNVDFILLYFTDESADRAAQIINAYKHALKPQGEFTRGLFYRGVE